MQKNADSIAKGGELQEINTIRCWAVFSLVIWHTFWAAAEIAPSSINGHYKTVLIFLIPDANMPLFTFISGYLFNFLLEHCGKYGSFKSFFRNKTNRLLIPFVVLGAATNIFEYGKDISDMLYGGPSHLWYCLMLFYCFIICWIIQKKVGDWLNLVLMLSSFVLTISFVDIWQLWNLHLSPGGWEFVAYYYCYFYFGYILFKYRDKLIVNRMSSSKKS